MLWPRWNLPWKQNTSSVCSFSQNTVMIYHLHAFGSMSHRDAFNTAVRSGPCHSYYEEWESEVLGTLCTFNGLYSKPHKHIPKAFAIIFLLLQPLNYSPLSMIYKSFASPIKRTCFHLSLIYSKVRHYFHNWD